MSRIRAKNTRPEMLVRRFLHGQGFRYRLHSSKLPGKPDIILERWKTVIFVHGCFWHGHAGCKYFKLPRTRAAWWEKKISRNRERDKENQKALRKLGWKVMTVWECRLKPGKVKRTLSNLQRKLNGRMDKVKVIDIFAGPGGLGEGFSAYTDNKGRQKFKIALSIEKDSEAHKTLTLRSFYRQFAPGRVPKEYYKAIKNEDGYSIDSLYKDFPTEAEEARREAWKAELGKTSDGEIDRRISEALGGSKDWLLIGGPPCQAYSLVGRSRRQQTKLDPKKDERVFLYQQYLRILAKHKPPVFVMENVKGLLSAEVESSPLFQRILDDLGDPEAAIENKFRKTGFRPKNGYTIYSLVREPRSFRLDGAPVYLHSDYVIKAENFGIPQTRHRVILLGIRNDLETVPEILSPKESVTVQGAIGDLPRLRSGLSKIDDTWENWSSIVSSISANGNFRNSEEQVKVKIRRVVSGLNRPRQGRGGSFIPGEYHCKFEDSWFYDPRIKGVLNHEARGHMESDLHRYLFSACFAGVNKRSPKLSEFPKNLLPEHENVNIGVDTNHFGDRFRVQVADQAAKTITSHISKDGHYYIHYDPSQCRSLTVREAARIQTFPDNYFFCGNRTSQYIQVGNAVPPLLAQQIANVVWRIFST
jgi:DNA (cytosine-5)-methyltransferase 1